MKRFQSLRRPALMLALAFAAGLLFQDLVSAQGRRGGRGSIQRGGKVVQKGGKSSRGQFKHGGSTRRKVSPGQFNRGQVNRSGKGHKKIRPNGPKLNPRRGIQLPGSKGKIRPRHPGIKPTKPGQIRPRHPGIKPTKPGLIRPTRPGVKPTKPGKPGPGTKPHKPRKPGPGTKPHKPRKPRYPSPGRCPDWKHKQKKHCYKGGRYDCIKYCRYVRVRRHLHCTYNDWCGYYPTACHWWYNWCGTRYYFDPTCSVNYQWYYCPVKVVYGSTVQHYSWHLGIDCVFIPGRGLGIQQVQAGSPAELAGLAPGMVILQANGVDLTSEGDMAAVIEQSGGLLNLAVIVDETEAVVSIDVQMQRMVTNSF